MHECVRNHHQACTAVVKGRESQPSEGLYVHKVPGPRIRFVARVVLVLWVALVRAWAPRQAYGMQHMVSPDGGEGGQRHVLLGNNTALVAKHTAYWYKIQWHSLARLCTGSP